MAIAGNIVKIGDYIVEHGSPKVKFTTYASFVAILIGYLFVLVPRLALAINADKIAGDFNLLPAALGVLASAYFCTYALTQAPSGFLADKIAPEILIVFSLIGITFANLLFVFAPNFNVAVISRLITGLTGSLVFVPALRFAATNFPQNFSLFTALIGSINGVCSMMVNGPFVTLSERYGWRSIFILSAFVCFITAIVLLVLYRVGNKKATGQQVIAQPPSTSQSVNLVAGLIQAFQNRLAWPMFLRIFVSSGVHMAFTSLWAGPYMMEILKMNRSSTGRALAIMSMITLIIGPLGGYLADKVYKTRRLPVSFGMLWSMLCWVPLVLFVDTISPLALTLTLSAMSLVGLGGGAQLAQVKEVYPPEQVGAAMGANNTFLILGCAVMPTVFGFVIGSGSAMMDPARQFRLVFLLNIALLAVATIASFASVETYGKTYDEIVSSRSKTKEVAQPL